MAFTRVIIQVLRLTSRKLSGLAAKYQLKQLKAKKYGAALLGQILSALRGKLKQKTL